MSSHRRHVQRQKNQATYTFAAMEKMKNLAVMITIITLVTVGACYAAGPSARQILENAARVYDAVQDYVVDAKLRVESPNIHVPEASIRIFFKRPRKLHVESDRGFAILPRQGVVLDNPVREILKEATLSLAGTDQVEGVRCYVIRVSHKQFDRRVESTLWVDARRWLVLRMSANPEVGPSSEVSLWYTRVAGKYWLPSRTHTKLITPPLPGLDTNKNPTDAKPAVTVIDMRFSKYKVNTGISDKIFEGENGKK